MFVTLRGERMYEFLDRFITVALPRVRDFRGVNDKSFDGRGNYSMGITEQIIFPEIDIDKVNKIMGMDISFVTSASTDAEAYALLKELAFHLRNKNPLRNKNMAKIDHRPRTQAPTDGSQIRRIAQETQRRR